MVGRILIMFLASITVVACSSSDPAGSADGGKFTYYYEQDHYKCPTTPGCTCSKDVGQSCSSADDCKGICCDCAAIDAGTNTFFAAVCLSGKCVQDNACALTLSKVTNLCSP